MTGEHERAHLRAVPSPEPAETLPRELPRQRVWWTACDLMAQEFEEPKWAVPGVFCEGVTLLCGPPKVGKSWLSLDLALTVASGGTAFGRIPVEAGPVLYLALEDTARRLQDRMRTLLAGGSAPENLTLLTACPALDMGGHDMITGWLDANPGARMIVVDVLTKVRAEASQGATAYQADYAALAPLLRISHDYSITVVVIHHVRKQGSDDFLATVSGTNGLAGAADATMVLARSRGTADGVLHMTGRDIEEAEHALAFSKETGRWTMLDGPAELHTTTDTRSAILAWLHANPGNGPRAIAAGTGLAESNVKKTCQRMAADGLLSADAKSRYTAIGQRHQEQGDTAGDIPGVPHVPRVSLLPLSWENSGDTQGDTQPGTPPVAPGSPAP
ncbi:AAA family ATPase [Longispora albida]|uniref:AAA family ATPase n=1 Tax=Longispora albida TaxID=203523 RepID=UPI00036E65B6|nr:AAA family ATPase [Longispora albida]